MKLNELNKKTIYIYKIEYDKMIIHTVEYLQYDKSLRSFTVRRSNIHSFALRILNNEIKAYAGKKIDNEINNLIEIDAYMCNGAPWIKGVNTTNSKEFLRQAIKYKFDYKAPLSFYL